jgi:hypothetical protein
LSATHSKSLLDRFWRSGRAHVEAQPILADGDFEHRKRVSAGIEAQVEKQPVQIGGPGVFDVEDG